ncbi:magnesium and cobalt transport protein CorA [Arsenicicoccus dermatophilus]|uniref:magnesium and cobalt transport protein CorA n=1 Tax=Arsenicicoccus dermatophilus TaxID=1076331 RepID=UPI001F4CE267|nr:magnesium and cobalt transport protein CorA [Arsenicicoccus dermatophilus]
MIVDQALYRQGRRQPCGDLSEELSALRDRQDDGFLWIGLKDPTDEEFALVNEELGLHPLAVEDALTGEQRAKLDIYDDTLFMVVKTLRYVERTSDVETGEVMLFAGDRFVLTVRNGEANPLAGVRARLELAPEQLVHGPAAVIYSVLDSIVDNYVLIDTELQEDLDRIERNVFGGAQGDFASEIYELKREVLEFKRASVPLAEPVRRLAKDRSVPVVHKPARPFFGDVLDHLLRVNDHVESYDRLLTDVLNAHLAQIGVRQNEDMRKISAWAAMGVWPTMIAGIYGQNFRFMPELEASVTVGGTEVYWGYWYALALMAGGSGYLYRLFKRSGWL